MTTATKQDAHCADQIYRQIKQWQLIPVKNLCTLE
uniref:Uncharacterized protein n=1 Tax=Arundo donax TaxID=35708 RepID=A0A0A9GQI3_ARUDO